MKKTIVLLPLLVLACFAANSAAVSPMPFEELRPGQTAIACTFHVMYMSDREKGTPAEEFSKTLFFEASAAKKEVLEEMIRQAGSRLDRGHPSEFRLECKFPAQ
jgi:hypothetical protein